MDPLSQAAIGAAAAQSISKRGHRIAHALWIGALAGLAPDLDVFIQSNDDPLLFLEYHRQFTHSLFFIPIGAWLCALAFHPLIKRHFLFWEVWLLTLAGYATHGLLDACTTYGTQLFWPFSNSRVAWHNISVIDPIFTVPLLIFVLLAALKRSRKLAVLGFCWALGYLMFGFIQHQRAISTLEQVVAERGHTPSRLEVKPGFGNILVWKGIYEFGNRYYVDGIRVGYDLDLIPGESVAKLDVETDFPWLNSSSQQAKDIERFRWFSDDWLAIDQQDRSLIVDMRYSQLHNAIKGLWGIRISKDRLDFKHVEWIARRETTDSELRQFFEQLKGEF